MLSWSLVADDDPGQVSGVHYVMAEEVFWLQH